jgi:hypothetical protein
LRGLNAFGEFIKRRGHLATVVLVTAIGAFLVIRGVVRLVG